MADRPILFSAPMVRALLDGRKTQTRRVFVPPTPFDPSDDISVQLAAGSIKPKYAIGDRLWVREALNGIGEPDGRRKGIVRYSADGEMVLAEQQDWLWQWKRPRLPSIHMPRAFSRLTLIVASVKVERLQDISAIDAEAEGVAWESADPPFYYVPGILPHSRTAVGVEEPGALPHAVRSYAKLWGEINGPGSWDANPWVVAISFRVVKANIDSLGTEDRA